MSQQLSTLRSRIQELELELQEFKSGRMVVSEDGSVVVNDMASEITMLRTENDKYDRNVDELLLYFLCTLNRLRMRIKALQQVVESQSSRLATFVAEKDAATLGRQDESTGQGCSVCVINFTSQNSALLFQCDLICNSCFKFY